MLAADILDVLAHYGIRDMSAVPSEKVLDAVDGSNRYMGSINLSGVRNRSTFDENAGQSERLCCWRQKRQGTEDCEATASTEWVPGDCLL